jgi:hypothetical protein
MFQPVNIPFFSVEEVGLMYKNEKKMAKFMDIQNWR